MMRAGLAVAVGVLLVLYFFDPEDVRFFPRCPFHTITGYFCAGCGSQRAIHSFLHLRFSDAFSHNFLVFPAAVILLYHYAYPWINRQFRWKLPNLLYMKNAPWYILGVIMVFFILRNLPYYPFTWLSPGNQVIP